MSKETITTKSTGLCPYFNWDKKYHSIDFEVPAVKILGITLRRGYTVTKNIDCEMGKSIRERLLESASKPNLLLKSILERQNAKT